MEKWGIYFDDIEDIYKMHTVRDGFNYEFKGTLEECKEYWEYNIK